MSSLSTNQRSVILPFIDKTNNTEHKQHKYVIYVNSPGLSEGLPDTD